MAEERAVREEPTGLDGEDVDGDREGEERERLAESLAARAAPTEPQLHNVEEAAVWEHRHIAPGSVISFNLVDGDSGLDGGEVALLITHIDHSRAGMDMETKVVGAEDVGTRARLHADFRRGKNLVHICYLKGDECMDKDKPAMHLRTFMWHPPGTFSAKWLTTTGRRVVK